MKKYPNHTGNLVALRRIEGQVRGIQKMVGNGQYCINILNQIRAVMHALARVEDKILEKHFEGCVTSAMRGKSLLEKKHKLSEIIKLIHQFRKI
ncbi:MAG: metal-sensitive transcriptional regulator [Candidatus Omnitrophica bacterium]|nr:metal-sensitive transcriptional regulator [Candidatus Omnitrophota bacterium]MDD5610323.1 metal-sensitive transcriptional regulator [Candidatus Omnitrophota bacterium]